MRRREGRWRAEGRGGGECEKVGVEGWEESEGKGRMGGGGMWEGGRARRVKDVGGMVDK